MHVIQWVLARCGFLHVELFCQYCCRKHDLPNRLVFFSVFVFRRENYSKIWLHYYGTLLALLLHCYRYAQKMHFTTVSSLVFLPFAFVCCIVLRINAWLVGELSFRQFFYLLSLRSKTKGYMSASNKVKIVRKPRIPNLAYPLVSFTCLLSMSFMND